jgi:hypothetical protein
MKWTPKISSRGEVRHGKSDLLSSLRVSDVSMQAGRTKALKPMKKDNFSVVKAIKTSSLEDGLSNINSLSPSLFVRNCQIYYLYTFYNIINIL